MKSSSLTNHFSTFKSSVWKMSLNSADTESSLPMYSWIWIRVTPSKRSLPLCTTFWVSCLPITKWQLFVISVMHVWLFKVYVLLLSSQTAFFLSLQIFIINLGTKSEVNTSFKAFSFYQMRLGRFAYDVPKKQIIAAQATTKKLH